MKDTGGRPTQGAGLPSTDGRSPPVGRADRRPRRHLRLDPAAATRRSSSATGSSVTARRHQAASSRCSRAARDARHLLRPGSLADDIHRRYRRHPGRRPRAGLSRLDARGFRGADGRTATRHPRPLRSRRSGPSRVSTPAGFRAPYWSFGTETLGLVEAAGFVYDSSLMADDYALYRSARGDRHSVTDGTHWGAETSLVEVPVYWAMDDWPHFEAGDRSSAACRPHRRSWRSGPRSCATHIEHAPGGLLIVTVHPECIGRGHRMAMLERFLDAAVGARRRRLRAARHGRRSLGRQHVSPVRTGSSHPR